MQNIGNRQDSLKCPRCGCFNTKFCYYNNYNLSQPRFFCKGCRRYWTKGGVLRNVPVGGRTRKPKRPKNHTCEPKLTHSHNSTSDRSIIAAHVSPETTAEAAPELISAPEMSSLTQQGYEDQVVENQNQWWQAADGRSEVGLGDGGVAAEDWGLFDQSYWWNDYDHRLNDFL